MRSVRLIVDRIVPALLMAVGVTLVVSGLLSYFTAPVIGEQPGPAPNASSSVEPGSPMDTGGPTSPGASDEPAPIIETLPPSPDLSPSPGRSVGPSPSTSPKPTGRATPPASPSASPRPTLPSGAVVVASRVKVPSLRIDLPVISGDVDPPGNRQHYPLCDVAQYLTGDGFAQPYEAGSTYVYAHARSGMFLPLLEASQRRNGKAMLGALVQLYTSDGRMWLYEIFQVKRHATDFSLALDVPAGEHRLVLQTSEGLTGIIPKLQVGARLLDVQAVSPAEANLTASPRVCS